MIDLYWEKSHCRGGYLHRYTITGQWEEMVEETCEICGESKYFPIIDGRTNNTEYLEYHMRQALVPQHELFYHEYKYNPYE